MFHEGEFEGRKVRPPVFLGRRPKELSDEALHQFYSRLLPEVNRPVFRSGQWTLCERTGWPDNSSYQNIVAWAWEHGQDRALVIVNLSDSHSQAHVQATWPGVENGSWKLDDAVNGTEYVRAGADMRSPGLYVELAPWEFHLFECRESAEV
jgi:hypothetical protein